MANEKIQEKKIIAHITVNINKEQIQTRLSNQNQSPYVQFVPVKVVYGEVIKTFSADDFLMKLGFEIKE